MLAKSDISISHTLSTFNAHNIEVALLVPTETGMNKSIMDATDTVRSYLRDSGAHDYATQQQGPDNKIIKRAYYVWPDRLVETSVSLYRPQTKKGDPRIWVKGLTQYAQPYNLLGIIWHNEGLYVVNCSNADILRSLSVQGSPLSSLAIPDHDASQDVVDELLYMLNNIHAKGFVRTNCAGDTGVGNTLEALLGIQPNCSKAPDYKGIEIKGKRLGKTRKGNRVNLFSQAPDWGLSPIGSAWALLSKYGQFKNGKLRLNHTISAIKPNSFDFMLEVDYHSDWLKQNHVGREQRRCTHVVTWELELLRSRLLEKHNQTFWVAANTRGKGPDEEFHFIQVEHTKSPILRNFETLIEGGLIQVDYLMSQKGPASVRDHGYLFKMKPSDFGALFPPSKTYQLG